MFSFALESELQDYIISNFSDLFNFEFVAKEYKIGKKGPEIDILGEDKERVYLIELKRDFVDHKTVKQIRRYLDTYKNQDGKSVVGIAAAPKIKESARLELREGENITLLELKDVSITETSRLNIALSGDILDKIDDYRRNAPGIPDRTNAIRELVQIGYEAFMKKKEKAGRE